MLGDHRRSLDCRDRSACACRRYVDTIAALTRICAPLRSPPPISQLFSQDVMAALRTVVLGVWRESLQAGGRDGGGAEPPADRDAVLATLKDPHALEELVFEVRGQLGRRI